MNIDLIKCAQIGSTAYRRMFYKYYRTLPIEKQVLFAEENGIPYSLDFQRVLEFVVWLTNNDPISIMSELKSDKPGIEDFIEYAENKCLEIEKRAVFNNCK